MVARLRLFGQTVGPLYRLRGPAQSAAQLQEGVLLGLAAHLLVDLIGEEPLVRAAERRAFFQELGIETVTSPATDRAIQERGTALAIDEACLSLKIYLGHVAALVGKCDFILVPRVSNYGRHRSMCTRFESTPDLVPRFTAFGGRPRDWPSSRKASSSDLPPISSSIS